MPAYTPAMASHAQPPHMQHWLAEQQLVAPPPGGLTPSQRFAGTSQFINTNTNNSLNGRSLPPGAAPPDPRHHQPQQRDSYQASRERGAPQPSVQSSSSSSSSPSGLLKKKSQNMKKSFFGIKSSSPPPAPPPAPPTSTASHLQTPPRKSATTRESRRASSDMAGRQHSLPPQPQEHRPAADPRLTQSVRRSHRPDRPPPGGVNTPSLPPGAGPPQSHPNSSHTSPSKSRSSNGAPQPVDPWSPAQSPERTHHHHQAFSSPPPQTNVHTSSSSSSSRDVASPPFFSNGTPREHKTNGRPMSYDDFARQIVGMPTLSLPASPASSTAHGPPTPPSARSHRASGLPDSPLGRTKPPPARRDSLQVQPLIFAEQAQQQRQQHQDRGKSHQPPFSYVSHNSNAWESQQSLASPITIPPSYSPLSAFYGGSSPGGSPSLPSGLPQTPQMTPQHSRTTTSTSTPPQPESPLSRRSKAPRPFEEENMKALPSTPPKLQMQAPPLQQPMSNPIPRPPSSSTSRRPPSRTSVQMAALVPLPDSPSRHHQQQQQFTYDFVQSRREDSPPPPPSPSTRPRRSSKEHSPRPSLASTNGILDSPPLRRSSKDVGAIHQLPQIQTTGLPISKPRRNSRDVGSESPRRTEQPSSSPRMSQSGSPHTSPTKPARESSSPVRARRESRTSSNPLTTIQQQQMRKIDRDREKEKEERERAISLRASDREAVALAASQTSLESQAASLEMQAKHTFISDDEGKQANGAPGNSPNPDDPRPARERQPSPSKPRARFEFALTVFPTTILVGVLAHLGYGDFRRLRLVTKSLRHALENGEAREIVLQRYLGPIGYRSLPGTGLPARAVTKRKRENSERGSEQGKPNGAGHVVVLPPNAGVDVIQLDLKDLEAFRVGLRYTIRDYGSYAKQHSRQPLDINLLIRLRASTRAWNRVVLRLRHQTLVGLSRDPDRPLYYFKNLPEGNPIYKSGRAPTLRVWVPTKATWMSDEEIIEVEREVWRSGVWTSTQRGDVVHNVAVGEFGNEGKLISDGKYLRDFVFTYDMVGHLPPWLDMLVLSPSYYHNVAAASSSNPVFYLGLSTFASSIREKLTLCDERVNLSSPQGTYAVKRFVYRSFLSLKPGTILGTVGAAGGAGPGGIEVVHEDWSGTLVIETDGTTEHAAHLMARCSSKAPAPFRIMREKSRPGMIWLRPVLENEAVN
ncbi:hypothetical protein T439DRAFT_348592 [Meredithblackwellia eburnea MCA 4105]